MGRQQTRGNGLYDVELRRSCLGLNLNKMMQMVGDHFLGKINHFGLADLQFKLQTLDHEAYFSTHSLHGQRCSRLYCPRWNPVTDRPPMHPKNA